MTDGCGASMELALDRECATQAAPSLATFLTHLTTRDVEAGRSGAWTAANGIGGRRRGVTEERVSEVGEGHVVHHSDVTVALLSSGSAGQAFFVSLLGINNPKGGQEGQEGQQGQHHKVPSMLLWWQWWLSRPGVYLWPAWR